MMTSSAFWSKGSDELVYAFYGLTPEKIKLVEGCSQMNVHVQRVVVEVAAIKHGCVRKAMIVCMSRRKCPHSTGSGRRR